MVRGEEGKKRREMTKEKVEERRKVCRGGDGRRGMED